MKGLGASAGSVRPQQQPHQLDPRACPLDPLHGRGPSGLQAGGTSARRHHRPHPVPGRGRHRPRLARVPRIQQTRPRRGARPTMSPDDPQTRPPGAYVPQSPRRCHLGPSGPPAVGPPSAPPRRRRPAQAARAPVPTDYFPYPTRRTCAHTTRPEREEEAMTLRYRGAGHTGKDAETRGNEHGRQSRGAPPLGGRPRQPPRPQALLLPPARVSLQRRPGALYDSLTLNELHHRSRRQSRVTGRHPALKCNQHH